MVSTLLFWAAGYRAVTDHSLFWGPLAAFLAGAGRPTLGNFLETHDPQVFLQSHHEPIAHLTFLRFRKSGKYSRFGNLDQGGYNTFMIGSIKGIITHKSSNYVIVETSGVGYKIFLPQVILLTLKVDQQISLVIHTYVREDQMTLYGFETLSQLEFFELLLTVSGVGPKSALGIMSLSSLDMIKSAIASGDAGLFKKVSGIGSKTAERVIVELREKLKAEGVAAPIAQEHSDALEALVSLGYRESDAREALKKIPSDVSIQEKIKIALKALGK